MALLGRLIERHCAELLRERGYRKTSGAQAATLYTHGAETSRHISFDRVRGGDLRLYLTIGRLPDSELGFEEEIEAESPWWPATDEATLAAALDDARAFLDVCGLSWLEDPLALTPSEWRERHNLLVRDYRPASVHVTWPETMSLNERVIRAKRCLPPYRAMSALGVRSQLAGKTEVVVEPMPLANALELKRELESEGFHVEIERNIP